MSEILNSLITMSRRIEPTINLQVTDYLPTETVQAKRHQRKSSRRWQKKWRKRFGTKQVSAAKIYKIGNTIYMDRETERKLKKHLVDTTTRFYDRQNSMLFNGFI